MQPPKNYAHRWQKSKEKKKGIRNPKQPKESRSFNKLGMLKEPTVRASTNEKIEKKKKSIQLHIRVIKEKKSTKGSFKWLSHIQFARNSRSSRPTGSSPCTFPMYCNIKKIGPQVSQTSMYRFLRTVANIITLERKGTKLLSSNRSLIVFMCLRK